MKKYVRCLIILIIPVIIFLLVNSNSKNAKNDSKIEKILRSEYYSYLPQEAQEYVRDVYEQTGNIVLTEKNKKVNTPYLNPQYVEYLTLDDYEKEKVEVIPDILRLDYTKQEYVSATYDSYYDLRNIDGSSFITPLKNQGNLGLCWALSSIEQAESYLMVSKNQPYYTNSDVFSVRQMDYATSNNGIINYHNENGYRRLSDGGNFFMSSLIMSNGLSLVNDEYMLYNELLDKKELSDILNYDNSKYEVNSTIMMPNLINNYSSDDFKEYLNLIKKYIMDYGGAYVGTGSPSGSCGSKNTDDNYIIVDESYCNESGNYGSHAMQIIGWDDNYEYSYCKGGNTHYDVNSSGQCSQGTLENGKGAWLIRNSWGDDSNYKYVYLSYDSVELDINFITSVSEMNNREWDNNYHVNVYSQSPGAYSNIDTMNFDKKIDGIEKINKVKFINLSQNAMYKISVVTDNQRYDDIVEFSVEMPGIYTVDLSDYDILLNSNNFTVEIESLNNSYLMLNTISVFTSNNDKTPVINTKNLNDNDLLITNDSYDFIVYSDTKNIPSNSVITYSLFKEGRDYSNYIKLPHTSKVAENNLNYLLSIDKNIPIGNYELNITYGNYTFNSNIVIPNFYTLEGSGTEDDPYKIYSEADLNQIRYDLDAYYILKSDITLTNDWMPIGTYNTPFTGGLDGDNHTIYNLKITNSNEDCSGLFGYVFVKFPYEYQDVTNLIDVYENTYIKNLKIANADISGNGDVGILIGNLIFDANDYSHFNIGEYNPRIIGGEVSMEISNVHFLDGSVISNQGNAGILVGKTDVIARGFVTPRLNINNVFTSASVSGLKTAGFIGFVNDIQQSSYKIMPIISIQNFQNVGTINVTRFNKLNYIGEGYSPVLGSIFGNAHLNINNYIINSVFDSYEYTSDFISQGNLFFIGYYNPDDSQKFLYNIGSGYYLSKFYQYNNQYTSVDLIKDDTFYNNWDDFDTYWKIETINSIKRIPVLKNINYNYFDMSDLFMTKYESQLFFQDNLNQYISFEEIANDGVVSIELVNTDDDDYYDNYLVTALKEGTATIHVINNYDGFEKDINIVVNKEIVANPAVTYYFDGSANANSYRQEVDLLQTFKLQKNRFTRKGYKFIGWNTSFDGSGEMYDDEDIIQNGIDENLRLYAQWEPIEYTIRFNANGGEGTMNDWPNVVLYENGSLSIPINKFSRDNYNFIGWNTKSDGSGLFFENHGTITYEQLISIEGDIFTLYAMWESTGGIITFNSNDGASQIKIQEYMFNSDTKLEKNTFTRNNYLFKGWNTEPDGSGIQYTDEQIINSSDNLVLYAQWEEIIPYTINNYDVDNNKKYIKGIAINTEVDDFTPNIILGYGYGIFVDTVNVDDKDVLYTGGKTRITHGLETYTEFINIILGDTDGNGKINYLDYVKVYNHIQKDKHPEINKKLLKNEYLVAADMSGDSKINYLDYVKIYNKIKELKGGKN
ncbi:MAG: InlB B-repeat-containing protein [Bacilli bacterium]|nr:InlB B-repeat-containing protein [Bacilli bacterium]